eukprot:1873957-Amphidinium_carterae.1
MAQVFQAVTAAHNAALHLIADKTNIHVQGLSQASRQLKFLNSRVRKRLLHLDIAYNLMRH